MKSVSKFALVFALGAFSVVPFAGAHAMQKEEKATKKDKKGKENEKAAPAAFQPKLSKEFSAVYSPVVNAYVKSKDAATAAAAWANIKAAIKSEDDRYQAGIFGVQIGSETKNDAMRSEAIDLVLASPVTPAQQRGGYTYMKGAFAYDAKNWAAAETFLIQAHAAGYKPTVAGGIEMLVANAMSQQKKFPEALDWMQKAIDGSKVAGATPLPANTYASAANFALKSKQAPLISKWMKELVKNSPSKDFWHDALIQSYNSVNYDAQETLDLLRLLRQVGAMKFEQNYAIYVDAADKRRLPAEVTAVLDEGFKAGTITKANLRFSEDYTDAKSRAEADRAQLAVVERDAQNAKTGFDAMLSGDIFLAYRDFAKAASIYEAALAKGGMNDREGKNQTDRALTRLGIAKLNLGDVAGARAAFAKVTSTNRREIADYWMIHADQVAAKGVPAS
jgi:tetratricopeptide (TPR) repeat protein